MDHSQSHAAHHWEMSPYPMILVVGIFFTVPIAFALFFQYHNGLMSALSLGIGVPFIVWGVAGWVGEGIAGAHKETGYALTGLPIFIVSEALIFLSLFVSYWMLRLSVDVWPPPGSPAIGVGLPIFMTIVLVSSSVTYHFGEMRLEADDKKGFANWVVVSILLGLLFLGCTIFEYNHLIHEGFTFSTNAKSTAFYSITGFHASHVLIGLCIFTSILIPALSGKVSHTYAKAGGIYWHFVDLIWFFVVSQLYLW
jgi:cytochrome c oxidase subunit 3